MPCSEKVSYFLTNLTMNYVSKMIFPPNRKGFATKIIPHKILEMFLVEKTLKIRFFSDIFGHIDKVGP